MKQSTIRLFVERMPRDEREGLEVNVRVVNHLGQSVEYPITGIGFGPRGLVLKTDTSRPMTRPVTSEDEERSVIEGDGWALHLSQKLKGAPAEVIEVLAKRLREVRA